MKKGTKPECALLPLRVWDRELLSSTFEIKKNVKYAWNWKICFSIQEWKSLYYLDDMCYDECIYLFVYIYTYI